MDELPRPVTTTEVYQAAILAELRQLNSGEVSAEAEAKTADLLAAILAELRKLTAAGEVDPDELRERLKEIKGVGDKTADEILERLQG